MQRDVISRVKLSNKLQIRPRYRVNVEAPWRSAVIRHEPSRDSKIVLISPEQHTATSVFSYVFDQVFRIFL